MLLRRTPAKALRHVTRGVQLAVVAACAASAARAEVNVFLRDVPDYAWHGGCFGTATGNLMGYWDRHGLPDFYTGPTAGGVAPLNSFGSNLGILSLWASERGLDGRPEDLPGHTDDYYVAYESVAPDPYQVEGRREHTPDCIGDFIGLSQAKWSDLGGECSGNIDAYSFNYFDREGRRRDNYQPTDGQGAPVPDIQSGIRAWAKSRGYQADSFSQLADFNPDIPPGRGFTFDDLRAEIDAGYPVLLFMQPFGRFSRNLAGAAGKNPPIHGMLAYGYVLDDNGNAFVRYRTSWASGDRQFSAWNDSNWTPNGDLNLPLRGVIGFRPLPKLVHVSRRSNGLHLRWEGPLSILRDAVWDTEQPAHAYVIERTVSLAQPQWQTVAGPVAALETDLPGCCEGTAFFRVRLTHPLAVD